MKKREDWKTRYIYRIESYINRRSSEGDYKSIFGRGGFSKVEKIKAAKALVSLLKGDHTLQFGTLMC
jgi:hypothetical protein